MRIKLFKDAPNGTVFRIMKEAGKSSPEKGLFVKVSKGGRSMAFSKAREIILGFSDVIEVVAYPSERKEKLSVAGRA